MVEKEKESLFSMSRDYFIEAQKDQPPEIKITRPGRDFRASPIEEVTVAVDAKDDFGLKEVTLHYSVNGGAEKTVAMRAGGARTSTGSTIIAHGRCAPATWRAPAAARR